MSQLREVVLAALLHDIGKFTQRAFRGLEGRSDQAKGLQDSICSVRERRWRAVRPIAPGGDPLPARCMRADVDGFHGNKCPTGSTVRGFLVRVDTCTRPPKASASLVQDGANDIVATWHECSQGGFSLHCGSGNALQDAQMKYLPTRTDGALFIAVRVQRRETVWECAW